MSGLSLSLLGSFQASIGKEPLSSFRTLKVQALLIYLVAEDARTHSRDSLMTLLWPGMPQRSAQSNLRQVIYYLRKIVPPTQGEDGDVPIEFLLAEHHRVQINPAYPCEVDVIIFKKLLQQVWDHEHAEVMNCAECAGRLRQAVELFRGDFLADFYLDDSNEFEEWAAILRESLSRSVLDALEMLTEVYIRQKDYRQARSYAEDQLNIDNLRENVYCQLMMIHALSGRHSEALAVYETYRRLLAEELGMAPTARTTNLYEQILAGEVSQQETPPAGVRGYELKEEIGSGYFGTVQRAIQTPIGREVAIKVIRPEFANNPDFIRRFEAEAQLIARLEHPHIVPLYDYWREPDRAFLVMRLLRGGSLRSALKAGPWPVERVASLVEQIAPALHAAHQRGILHRNLKPSNILLDEEGYAYLSDFGIAIEPGEVWSISRGAQSDSLNYVSPEQILDDPITPQSDIYSLGLVLYEALCGEKPFGQAALADLLKNHLEEPLPLISSRNPGLPTRVDRVIQRATARNPIERYADALALAADFHKAIWKEKASAEEIGAEPTTAAPGGVNPYKGLRPFREEDAGDFFGREALVQQLLEHLASSRFLAVVGPSGIGKSSVVSAGLIRALRNGALPGSDRWFIAQMTPGTHPLEALELALLKVAVNPPPSLVEPMLKDELGLLRTLQRILPEGDAHLLLVVDQFEELYTLTVDERQREHFIDSLLAAIRAPASPLRVVITLRADFYDRPLAHLPLGELLLEHTEGVLPLSPEELEQVVRGPAERAGVRLEPGLMAAIAADVSDQPGALPLLQYALTELFEARQDHTLTRSAYQDMDGIAGALGSRAESLFETLEDGQRAAARQVFLRLVTLGEGVEDTRRRVLRSELESLGEKSAENSLDPVLDLFGHHRLLTFDRDALTRQPTVEVAHEALLRAWPRLHAWLEESRDDIRLQRRLAEAATEWKHAGRDDGFLLRGSRLDQMAGWGKDTTLALTEGERAFLDASLQSREARRMSEAEQLAHQARLERRSRNFLGGLVAVLGLATLLALFLSNYAFGQRDLYRQESQSRATQQFIAEDQAQLALDEAAQRGTAQAVAEDQRSTAVVEANTRATAQAELDQERDAAEGQAQVARSRELASLAQLKIADDPELGMLLALEGLRTSRTVEAENALRLSLISSRLERTLYGYARFAYWLRVSPDGKSLASAPGYPGETIVWDLTSGRRLFTFPAKDIADQFDGKQLVTLERDQGQIIKTVWSVETGELIEQQVVPGVRLIQGAGWFLFNPDLTQVVVSYPDGWAELWDAIRGELLWGWQAHTSPQFWNVTFSPDGRLLVTDASDGIKIWDTHTREELLYPAGALTDMSVDTAAFSPDGRLLASSGENNAAVIWDVEASIQVGEAQALLTLRGHTAYISAYAFSADGTRLATVANDNTARVWSVIDGQPLFTLPGHQGRALEVAFTPDGEHLVTSDWIGDIRIWDLTPAGRREVSTLALEDARFKDLDYAPDGSWLATVGLDGHLRLWSEPGEELLLDFPAHDGQAYHVAFSPDGKRIATTGGDNRAVIWDAQTGTEQFSIQGHAEGYTYEWHNYQTVAYSPDGLRLATGGTDGLVKLWDAASGDEIVLPHPISMTQGTSPAGVLSLAFSPDGRYLAVIALRSQQALVFDSYSGERVLVADTDNITMWTLSFSPDGSRLAIGHLEAVRVIDFPASLAAGEAVELFTLYANKNRIFRIDFSPDGRYLASAGRDTIVRVWDAVTGDPLAELPGMSDTVWALQFSPDGRYLRAAGYDDTVRKYVVSTDDLIELAYQRLTRWWRPEECSLYLRLAQCPEPQKEITRVDYATSPAELEGTWQTESVLADAYLRFQEDGRLIAAQTLSGLDEASPLEDTYEIDGDGLSISMTYPGCPDDVGRYRQRLVREPGQPLRLILGAVAESCLSRYKYLNGSYVQVAP